MNRSDPSPGPSVPFPFRRVARPGRVLGLALAAAAVLAACGAETVDTPPMATPDRHIDLSDRTVSVRAGDLTIAFCDGDGPFLCISRNGEHLGSIEYASTPLGSYDVVRDVLAAGGDHDQALRAHASDFLASFEHDRPAGCGPDYQVVPEGPTPVTVAERDGMRVGFRGMRDGRTLERVMLHAVIEGDTFYSFTTSGYEPDGCLSQESHFRVAELDAFAPLLDRILAQTTLPPLDPGPDTRRVLTGRVVEVYAASASVELDPLEVLSGEEARQAAVRAGELPEGEELPNDVYLHDPDASTERYTVDPEASVEVYDCRQGCGLVPVALADLLNGRVEPYGGRHTVWTLTLVDDRITTMAEVYLP
jgi:hypothetical protein